MVRPDAPRFETKVVHLLSLSLARHYQNEKEMTYTEIG
jgi:hypothetical protein